MVVAITAAVLLAVGCRWGNSHVHHLLLDLAHLLLQLLVLQGHVVQLGVELTVCGGKLGKGGAICSIGSGEFIGGGG
jgi:hypothetical protein